MTTKISDATARRILAIRNQQESAAKIGSEKEAETFMEVLLSLLAKYKMELSDIEALEESLSPLVSVYFCPEVYDIEVKSKTDCPLWLYYLSRIIGETHGCMSAYIDGTNRLCLHGTAQNTKLCADTLGYMGRIAMRLAMRSYRSMHSQAQALGMPHLTKGYKASFLFGFVTRIGERLKESTAKLDEVEKTGLVLINRDLVRAEESLINQSGVEKVASDIDKDYGKGNFNPLAYGEGTEVANRQVLKPKAALG